MKKLQLLRNCSAGNGLSLTCVLPSVQCDTPTAPLLGSDGVESGTLPVFLQGDRGARRPAPRLPLPYSSEGRLHILSRTHIHR